MHGDTMQRNSAIAESLAFEERQFLSCAQKTPPLRWLGNFQWGEEGLNRVARKFEQGRIFVTHGVQFP